MKSNENDNVNYKCLDEKMNIKMMDVTEN